MSSTDGLRILLTGAAGGIGRALLAGLVDDGARVVASDHAATGDGLTKLGVPSVVMDVADPESVAAGVAEAAAVHGGLDALVHVAGVTGNVPFLDIDIEEWHRVLSVNLDGPFLVGRAVAAQLVQQGSGGSLTFVTSQLAARPLAGKSHYVTSKAGLEALVRSMALELAEHGVRVNALAPGVFATRMALDRLEASSEVMDRTLAQIPVGRLGTPSELVAATLLLAGSGGSYLTGTTITVDGGYLVR